MKNRFRLISRGSRGGALYCVDGSNGKRTSLSSCSLSDIFTKFRRLSLGIGFHDLRFTRKTHAGVMGCSPHGEKGNREKRERHLFMSQSGRGDKQNHCQEARGGGGRRIFPRLEPRQPPPEKRNKDAIHACPLFTPFYALTRHTNLSLFSVRQNLSDWPDPG